ncbi:pantothenate synthetase [Cyclobacterium xiamenense]|uniref:Pantothenate synthetase n=1 Tax=Cyclobacterium xiamenense TaxID=1297121 RepID=A0A1H6W8F0_9BACT|nr:pantoate--beta-alanine ligase [Cyclobacterium xiamenense]SEJ13321.1 pantothenate synthetase [Cyclobacterium xiamenense]
MEKFETIPAVRHYLKEERRRGKSVGLVPTMGALHQGHVELIRQSKNSTDTTVVSLFVNPIQFNSPEDLENYPRDVVQDLELLAREAVDVVFIPDEREMYPEAVITEFDFGPMEQILEGQFRPGHFNGVGIVVSKLLHIIQPDDAFFGQKDLQQVTVIRRLVRDLSFDTRVVTVPTVREANGLALSSRNRRLSKEGGDTASLLHQTLLFCQDELLKGGDWLSIKKQAINQKLRPASIEPEYLEMVELNRFSLISRPMSGVPYALCIAAFIEKIRLIDNIVIGEEQN